MTGENGHASMPGSSRAPGEAPVPPDLTVSIVTAGNLDLLLPCLHSVFERTRRARLEVFVVDDASANDAASAVRTAFPRVCTLRNEVRQGFASNNNLVLGRGRGRYVLLLNDDTLILEGALDRLVAFMEGRPRAGACGALLLNPDGSFQPSFARFPHPLLEGLWPAANWSYGARRWAAEPFPVDSVCGAALLVRRSVLDQVGLLDTGFDPGYSEEIDWCYRIKRAGWQIYAVPGARIIHYGSQTMDRDLPRKYELLLSHKALFFRKHHGPRAAALYRASLGLSTTAKVAWWALAGLWPPGRQASRQRCRLHLHLLRRIPSW
jgi:GT2 family glycosyltransferase